ncbi:MAG: hypothetical protein PVF83_04755, partial [Anaerolineales bacterium]
PPPAVGCGGCRHPPQIKYLVLNILGCLPIKHKQPTILNLLHKPHIQHTHTADNRVARGKQFPPGSGAWGIGQHC